MSTRGEAAPVGFADAVLNGLAEDGGLYLPAEWPRFSPAEIADMAALSYPELACRVIGRFADRAVADDALKRILDTAYATFRHPAVLPLVQIGPNHFLLELFHGPTLAFKDVAMQALAGLMDHLLAERGERATVVGATSGDTGGAAIEAFRGRARVDVAILFPHCRVSDVQRRQMTTVADENVRAIAIDGTFDDAQRIVKALFRDRAFAGEVRLSGVNSINFGRIVAQSVYYFHAALLLGAPHRPVSFTVPTGNFGNVFAGYAAALMGLPIERLVVATNANDILHRTLETGRYEVKGVEATVSPSMDIQVSSNFERLLFEAGRRDATLVRRAFSGLSQSGAFGVEDAVRQEIGRLFASGSAGEAETLATIARVEGTTGEVIDPHTAVGVAVAERHRRPETPMVTLATAHPAKFPQAVARALGRTPPPPPAVAALFDRPERALRLPAEEEPIRAAIREMARVSSEKAAGRARAA